MTGGRVRPLNGVLKAWKWPIFVTAPPLPGKNSRFSLIPSSPYLIFFNLIPAPNIFSNQKGSSFKRRFQRLKRYWFTFIFRSDLFHFLGYLSRPRGKNLGDDTKNRREQGFHSGDYNAGTMCFRRLYLTSLLSPHFTARLSRIHFIRFVLPFSSQRLHGSYMPPKAEILIAGGSYYWKLLKFLKFP